MLLSPKQIEFVRNMHHRWNFKGGATRSGKTYLDFRWVIPLRIRERIGRPGLVVILGVTKSTIERNVLEPMREVYGDDLVGSVSSDNTVILFGEKCYCLGAEKVSQVSKIRGASIKYCYGDEVADWSSEVFELLKSRLDKSYSCFDGTFNPQYPNHWLKKFLDSDVDIYSQTYTLDDNPFNPPEFVENLKKEYAGTVFYDRYILGKWVRAQGAIYTTFVDKPDAYAIQKEKWTELRSKVQYITVGIDFGGNKSAHTFVASAITRDWGVIVLRSKRLPAQGIPVEVVIREFILFAEGIERDYGGLDEYGEYQLARIDTVFPDNAEAAIINSMDAQTKYNIRGSVKGEIIDRIRATDILINSGRLHYIAGECDSLVAALSDAVWDDKQMQPVRLDDGSYDVDTLDAFEYSWSWGIGYIIRR